MSTDIVPRHSSEMLLSDDELNRTWRISKALAASGRFPDARTAEQALAKVLLGRDLGLNPTQAMTGIHIVEGKPQIAAVTLASFVRQLPGYDYQIVSHDDEVCEIEFSRDGEPLGTSSFTMDDAKRAGLVKDKSGWVKYPRNMLFARAMSNGVKWFCPEATHGIPVYHEGEIEETPPLGAGHGDGTVQGIALGPEVDEVLRRAEEIGHAGLADRATAEMALADQPAEFVAQWVQNANRELSDMADRQVTDAEVVPDPEPESRIEEMRGQARRMADEAQRANEEGDGQVAIELEGDARELLAEADELEKAAGG